ncbi:MULTISPECIES: hypothetical protein [Symbiopectobacterium]|uniref:hypothetical protein n=1 Tax=Symbiopectobacterium TaxID=801 RepID=UPI001A32332C|nr:MULTISPECIES: hypothetical protein [Symbiopectobacterium]MBG6247135.1 hypothetical protein [Candidatus Symbiopectobacterium sp. PLON1]MBT9428197.1 hypothetical protein [Candidatus Symbiopectobacterium endolongispinus]
MDKLFRSAAAVKKGVKLGNIKKVFDMYIKSVSDKMSGLSFFVSDYDVAIAKLHDYFIDGNKKVLFASFVKNEVSFERKE